MDLFETPERLPKDIRIILNSELAYLDNTYENCEKLLKKVEALGYTFDYYLDAIPHNLRKIL